MWKNSFIEVLVLLMVKVSNIQSGCGWDDSAEKDCSLNCKPDNIWGEQVTTTMGTIEQEWPKRPNCHEMGIDLKLENLKYASDTLKLNFFTADVKVRELSIIIVEVLPPILFLTSSFKKVEIDAFHVDGLKFLKKLVLDGISFTPIQKGIFNGLEYLEVLNIKGRQLRKIESGVIDVCNATLKEFSLEEFNTNSDEIIIDGLTASATMQKLENVKFRYNLKTSITKNALSGLTNVKILDLSDCQIETIEAGAFDSMISLELLKLEDNHLTNIPGGFFDLVLDRAQIFLKGNRFICDCDLMPFKMSLMEHSNFVGELECDNGKYEGHNIIEITFCNSPPTTELSTSAVSSTSPSSSSQVCTSSDGSEVSEVFIKFQAQSMEIVEAESDGVVLQVDEFKKNSVLIWFSSNDQFPNYDTSDDINCAIGSGTNFRVDNLMKNLAYTFCLMDSTEVTISPLDCISYMRKSEPNSIPWLYHNTKNRTIGIALAACVLSILLGVLIGILTHKIKVFQNNKKEHFVRSYHSSRASSMRRSRTSFMTSDSYMTRRTTNTTVQYFLNDNIDPPPLPARPLTMYLMEEPVYATIRDIASIKTSSQTSDIL